MLAATTFSSHSFSTFLKVSGQKLSGRKLSGKIETFQHMPETFESFQRAHKNLGVFLMGIVPRSLWSSWTHNFGHAHTKRAHK
jgi:hypothetical protein